jgi:hypothetical protein
MGKTLTIRAPQQFQHAGRQLSADRDPRAASFAFDELDIDLRRCEFIRPAAVLWCVVYLALARRRGVSCRLLVPERMGVCMHLKATGVFEELKQRGVDVDDRDVATAKGHKSVLPLTPFATLHDAARITNEAYDRLVAANVASANVTPVVAELFSELANNAVEHSESPVGAFGWIQFVDLEQGSRFVCVVADGGIGVKQGLWKNPVHRKRVSYDWDALELSTRERVSGTGEPHKGIGLYAVAEDARQRRGSLLLHSGLGSLEISEERESKARRTRLFPGTLAYLAIPA